MFGQIGDGAGPAQGDAPPAAGEQLADVVERHQATGADDRDAIADPLNLGEHMAREEDRVPLVPEVLEDAVEGVLHQRVEPLGRLIQDGELRIVLERLDHADLLAHPTRVVTHLALQDAAGHLQAVAQLAAPDRLLPLQVGEVVERIAAAQRVVQRDPAGQVAGSPAGSRRSG